MKDVEYQKEATRKLAHAKASKRGVFAFDADSDECCNRMVADGLIVFRSEEERATWKRKTVHYDVTEAGWRFLAAKHEEQPVTAKQAPYAAPILKVA